MIHENYIGKIRRQNESLDDLYNKVMDSFKEINKNIELLFKGLNREQVVVYAFFILGSEYIGAYQNEITKISRLMVSIRCLLNNTNALSERNLLELRIH